MRWLLPLILFILLAAVGWLFLTPSSAPGTIPPSAKAEEDAPHAVIPDQPSPTAQDQTSENVPAPSRTKIEQPTLAKADVGPWVTAQLLSPDGSPAKGAFAWLARKKQELLMSSASWTIRSGKLDYPTFKADELGMVRVPHNQGKPNWLKVGGEHWVRVEMDVSDWKKDQDLDLGTITLFPAFSIHGTLTDFNQNPLRQQTIFLEGDATNSPFNRAPPLDLSISDDEGGFQFFGLTPGEYKVKATPQGWVAKTQNVEILDQDLNLYLEVLPGLTMQGQVVDHEGNPIPSARVRLDDQSLFYGFQPFSIKENEGVGVNQNGYFTCSGMPETGKKTLQVSAPGFLCSKPQFVSAGTFIKVNLRPACQLAGRIVDWNQQPVVKARVACTTQEDFGDTLTRGSQTDGEGKFLFEKLAPGKAKLAITSQFGALTLELSIEKIGEFLEIELPKVAGWKLLVIDPGGTPIPKAYIRIEESIPEPENRTFDIFSLGNSLWENPGTSAGTTDGNGKWMVYGLQDVTLLLTVSKRGWVKSVQKLRPPSAEKDFTVVLEKAAILNVTLLKADGSPADDISLGFFSEAQSELAGLMVEHTDKNGKATFDQLNGGPGELRLYGMQREAHENERWPIQLVAGESSSITCHLPTECTLRVLVLDNGNPVPRAKINLHPLHEDESDDLFRELRLAGLPGKGHTGPDGVAFISGLDAIEYEIVAQPPLASPPHRQRVFVTEGENLLTLELSQGRLEGRIRDSFGPVQNGRVSLHPIKTEEEDASKGDFHTISFSMNGEMYEWAPSGAFQKTNLDGVFSFRHLSKGLWEIRIKAAGHLDWISEPISLPAHGFHDMGSIFLEASGSLKGQILNLPAEGTFTSMTSLSLQPTKEGEYAYLHSTFDTAGNYSFSTVPAGEYTLTISFQVEVESLRKFETEPIQILQGQETVFVWKMPN